MVEGGLEVVAKAAAVNFTGGAFAEAGDADLAATAFGAACSTIVIV